MSLKGKVAVVTGGSRGIGKAICLELASCGADIAFFARRPAPEVEAELSALGVGAKCYPADVADYSAVSDTFRGIVSDFGTVDILVNNAGITCDKLLLSMTPEDFDGVVKTNLYGVFNTVKQVYPIFMRKRSGRIINVSSVSGLIGNPGQANYSASKAGVIGLTKAVARELGPRGVTCNAIAPGFVETDMTAGLPDTAGLKASIPARRFGRPEEIAACAAWLASDGASYVNGAVITADGGMTCR